MTTVKTPVIHGEINGFCDPRFERVATAFEHNFREYGEIGASVCVTFEGKSVVNLWGGMARPATNEPWTQETLSIVWSSTKGATALCAHILASRGLLDFDKEEFRALYKIEKLAQERKNWKFQFFLSCATKPIASERGSVQPLEPVLHQDCAK